MAVIATLTVVLNGGCGVAHKRDANLVEGLVGINKLPNAYHVASVEDDAVAVRVINGLHFDPYLHPDGIAVTVSKGVGQRRGDG